MRLVGYSGVVYGLLNMRLWGDVVSIVLAGCAPSCLDRYVVL